MRSAPVKERAFDVVTDEATYLGPVVVVEATPARLEVEVPDGGTVGAEMALAFPYEARVGDVVLAIGRAGRYYVIGVLAGTGRTVLSLQGDVELHAEGGQLRLSGTEGVSLEGPEIAMRARKLRTIVDSAVQTFGSLCQNVRELFSLRAGQSHTLVDGASYAQAKQAAIVSEETVTINGKAVHLG